MKGFIALLIGGIVSPWGALVGGLTLGVFEVATAYYIGSLWSEGIGFAVLMVFLVVRPTGILGERGARPLGQHPVDSRIRRTSLDRLVAARGDGGFGGDRGRCSAWCAS